MPMRGRAAGSELLLQLLPCRCSSFPCSLPQSTGQPGQLKPQPCRPHVARCRLPSRPAPARSSRPDGPVRRAVAGGFHQRRELHKDPAPLLGRYALRSEPPDQTLRLRAREMLVPALLPGTAVLHLAGSGNRWFQPVGRMEVVVVDRQGGEPLPGVPVHDEVHGGRPGGFEQQDTVGDPRVLAAGRPRGGRGRGGFRYKQRARPGTRDDGAGWGLCGTVCRNRSWRRPRRRTLPSNRRCSGMRQARSRRKIVARTVQTRTGETELKTMTGVERRCCRSGPSAASGNVRLFCGSTDSRPEGHTWWSWERNCGGQYSRRVLGCSIGLRSVCCHRAPDGLPNCLSGSMARKWWQPRSEREAAARLPRRHCRSMAEVPSGRPTRDDG